MQANPRQVSMQANPRQVPMQANPRQAPMQANPRQVRTQANPRRATFNVNQPEPQGPVIVENRITRYIYIIFLPFENMLLYMT